MSKKAILIILDGWGIGDGSASDVIQTANTTFIKSLYKQYPHSQLETSGIAVGLPEGQMGNSEVGHLNIGAGRVVYQDLVRINKDIEENTIIHNMEINKAYDYAKANGKAIHFIGLVSDGGVHSQTKHLMKLCDMAQDKGLDKVYIHALTDGRDTDPRSGLNYVAELHSYLKNSAGVISTICGRYYTMDRDKRWERVKIGYDLLVSGQGQPFDNPIDAIKTAYANDITDEFIKPVVITDENGIPYPSIQEGDVVFCFNYRTDRLRQITTALTQTDLTDYGMKTIPLYYVTMTQYDENFKNIHIAFDKQNLSNTMGEVLEKQGKTQLRIAETEKYAHVTFFFSGGQEGEYKGEQRILIPSPKVATYDLQPEMSAPLVKDEVVKALAANTFDFICLNFANGDMVGHTGIYEAITKAVETVDACVKEVVTTAIQNDYVAMIIADHGNADFAKNADGSPNTAHSTNPVPCLLINSSYTNIHNGQLSDVAPTLLKIMDIAIPTEMDGKVLV